MSETSFQGTLFLATVGVHRCEKYRNFTLFPGAEILWKDTVSAEYWANLPKLCVNCAFLQNFTPGS